MRLWDAISRLKNRDYIPPLPRLYATEYEQSELTPDVRRVLARLGARDTVGITLLMRRLNVATIDELVKTLDHYQPRRNIAHRLYMALGRLIGGLPYQPHVEDIRRLGKKTLASDEINQRLKNVLDKMR